LKSLKTEEKKAREAMKQEIIEMAMNKDWDADRTSEYLTKMHIVYGDDESWKG
jgi:hypothetical protein